MSSSDVRAYDLRLGSRGRAVRALKELLGGDPRISYRRDASDVYDQALLAAVMSFQRATRLPRADGTVDAATWAMLGRGQVETRLRQLAFNNPTLYSLLRGGAQTATARQFVIVYGDQGTGEHNAGDLFVMSAQTHEKEVKAKAFPGVPAFGADDEIRVAHVSTVAALVKELSKGNVLYLAYFGHSWNDGVGSLYIGQAAAPDTNLSDAGGANDTSVRTLPTGKFRKDAQVRLFGCRGGFGAKSSAEQIAKHLGVKVFAYTNSGGSLFTQDKLLGHGKRAVKRSDIDFKAYKRTADTWLVPINGTPSFKEF